MSKLEVIKEVLAANPEVTWEEEGIQLAYHRLRSGYYYSTGLRVAPRKPILRVAPLRQFSAELVRQLIPLGPTSVSWCYIFPGRREAVRLAALYFQDMQNNLETTIKVSIYPCQVMAQNVGYRAIIELGGYECPEPCEFAPKCIFRVSKWRALKKLL